MDVDLIVEIGITAVDALYVKPRTASFPYIYRAAMEVSWDSEHRTLITPTPREWSHARWFKQIILAVESEYGTLLRVGIYTQWENVPENVRQEIKAIATTRSDNA